MPNNGKGPRQISPLLVRIEQLDPDPENPRFRVKDRGRTGVQILETLLRQFDLDELAASMSQHGYFAEEPLVAVPADLPEEFRKKTTEQLAVDSSFKKYLGSEHTRFIVVEGNRRLATAKILLSSELRTTLSVRNWPEVESPQKESLLYLPCIIYPSRKEVLPYLGVRHITGIKKWEAFEKAVYIADMIAQGFKMVELQREVGDNSNSVPKTYACYKLIEQAEEENEDLNLDKARDLFSYLILAVGQGPIKEYLGLQRKWQELDFSKPLVSKEKQANLRSLLTWLYGVGTTIRPVIFESRDITRYLSPVLRSQEATKYLEQHKDLEGAYERSDGEEELLLRYIDKARTYMEKAMGLLYRFKDKDAIVDSMRKMAEAFRALEKNAQDK